MDPFSIIVGTVGLIDVSVKVARFLRAFEKGVADARGDLDELQREIGFIEVLSRNIETRFKKEFQENSDGRSIDQRETKELWAAVGRLIIDCKRRTCDLENLLKSIYGDTDFDALAAQDDQIHPYALENWKIQFRKFPKSSKIDQIRNDLRKYKGDLSVCLGFIGQ